MKEKLKLEVQVTKIESEKTPEVKGLASVQFGGFRINNIRVVERQIANENGELESKKFVSFPQHKGVNKDGETQYKEIVSFGGDEEQGRKIKSVLSNMILKGLEGEEKTNKITKETDFEIDKELLGAYINPTPNSEKILGVGSIYYGGLLSIRPVFVKEAVNSEKNEKFNTISFETRTDKEGNYNEVVHPTEEGLRKKCVEVAMESIKKNKEIINEDNITDEKKEENKENEKKPKKTSKKSKKQEEADIEV